MPQKNCNSIAYCKMLILLFAECCNIIHHLPDCTFLCYLKKVSSKGGKAVRKSGLVWVASFEEESCGDGTEV